MGSFEFLSVLISVVVGLGIANILTGIGRVLHRRRSIEVSAPFVLWTFFIFLYHIIYWWTVVFGWQEWQNWNILFFVFVLFYGIILYLLSVILYPTDMPENWNPHQSLMNMRHWFFGIFLLLVVVEAFDSYFKNHLEEFSPLYYAMLVIWAAGAVVGLRTENKSIHTVSAMSVLVVQVAWIAYQLRDLEWVLQ